MKSENAAVNKPLRFPFVLVILIFSTVWMYWASGLSFLPVPWPDDSAFFLTGYQWLYAPFKYLMHSQAPFVPTYDQANFNTMPLLPLLMGLAARLGFETVHALRIFGMLAFGAYVFFLALWMQRKNFAIKWIWLISLAALFSPAIRWGAMLVRPEVYVGLLGLLILMDLDGAFRTSSRWRIPIFLAVAAGIHFEAIIWVLPTAVGIFFQNSLKTRSFRLLLGVAGRTALLLSPWIIYVLMNWNVFWIQMHTQFHRLEADHPYTNSLHAIFHNLFLLYGSPIGFPKFFTVAKIITWGFLIWSFCHLVYRVFRCATSLRKKTPMSYAARQELALSAATALGLVAPLYLWFTKPETWFTALIHTSLWPAVIVALRSRLAPFEETVLLQEDGTPTAFNPFEEVRGFLRRHAAPLALSSLIILVGIQWIVSLQHAKTVGRTYQWSDYARWISCIDRTIGVRKRVWQPSTPDALIELMIRRPDRDYTRAVDFPNVHDLVQTHADKSDVILYSMYFQSKDPEAQASRTHQGVPRTSDRERMLTYPWIAYTGFYRSRQAHLNPDQFVDHVCHVGPFWAFLSMRK